MQIVIDIPEEEYKCVQITGHIGNTTQVSNAIFTGTPLPKGHGRLIDADAFVKRYECDRGRQIYVDNFIFDIEMNTPTIIETDKEVEE